MITYGIVLYLGDGQTNKQIATPAEEKVYDRWGYIYTEESLFIDPLAHLMPA